MKYEREGVCRYCGQVQVVDIVVDAEDIEGAEFDSAEEFDRTKAMADDKATQQCTCPESREAFAMEKVDEVLNILLGDHALENGYDSRADGAQMAIRADCVLRIIEILENGGVTHPNIARRVAAAYKLGKRDAGKLHPTKEKHEEAVAESRRYMEKRYGVTIQD